MAYIEFFDFERLGVILLNRVHISSGGYTETSMYPKLWEAMGNPFSELLTELVQLALEENPIP